MALPARTNADQLSRWEPFGELDRLQRQFRHLLDTWAGGDLLDGFTPPAEIEETDGAWLVDVEVPGVKRDDIDIELSGRRLSISGERKEKERTGVLRRRTRTLGRFQFEAVLGGEVDEDGVEASLDEGVLRVRLPKAAKERPRRVAIT